MSQGKIPTPEQVAEIEKYDTRITANLTKPQEHRRTLIGWVNALLEENQRLAALNHELLTGGK